MAKHLSNLRLTLYFQPTLQIILSNVRDILSVYNSANDYGYFLGQHFVMIPCTGLARYGNEMQACPLLFIIWGKSFLLNTLYAIILQHMCLFSRVIFLVFLLFLYFFFLLYYTFLLVLLSEFRHKWIAILYFCYLKCLLFPQ